MVLQQRLRQQIKPSDLFLHRGNTVKLIVIIMPKYKTKILKLKLQSN
jgi:hypothetical protein